MIKRDQDVFLPEGAVLAIPGYSIRIVAARDGFATLTVRKRSKKLRGVRYKTIVIDEALFERVKP
jgi:hypothetical protein